MKTCPKCKKYLQENDRFCDKCGFDTEETYNKNQRNSRVKNIVCIVVVLLGIILSIVFIIAKDPLLYKHYLNKGDNEVANTKAIEYYKKALDIKYTDELVNKIAIKISKCSNFDEELTKLKGIINSKDLDKMYIDNYIYKAEELYNNGDVKGTWDYVRKANAYGFKEQDFRFYEELVNELDKELIPEENNEKDKQDINIIINDDEKEIIVNDNYPYYDNTYFIIPDSHTRYLSESELIRYSKNELALIRNEIFARRGYIFNKKAYQDYFSSMPWYVPNKSFKGSTNELNNIERNNVELIKNLE